MLLTRAGFIVEPPLHKATPNKEFSVTLIHEQQTLENEAPQTEEARPEKVPQALAPTSIAADIMVMQPSQLNEQETQKFQLSKKSREFRRFLKSETERNANGSGESIVNFNQSFETTPKEGYAEELSPYHSGSIPKGGNNDFAVAQNGRVRCVVRTLSLYDIAASPNYVSKDCTPQKTLDLKLNKPNKDWTER